MPKSRLYKILSGLNRERNYIFIIRDNQEDSLSLIVKATDLYDACLKAWRELRKLEPAKWTDKWQDLYHVVRNGDVTCFESNRVINIDSGS